MDYSYFQGWLWFCRQAIPYKVLLTKWGLTEWRLAIQMQNEEQNAVHTNAKLFELRSDEKAANSAACVSPIRAYMPSDSLVNVSVMYGQFLATLQIYNRKEASLAKCADNNSGGRKSVKEQLSGSFGSLIGNPALSFFQAVKVATYHKAFRREGMEIKAVL